LEIQVPLILFIVRLFYKYISTVLCVVGLTSQLNAQHLRVEAGLDILVVKQAGHLETHSGTISPAVYTPVDVDRSSFHIGLRCAGYYPIKEIKLGYEDFSIGPGLGISILNSKYMKSTDPSYRSGKEKYFNFKTAMMHFPLTFQLRNRAGTYAGEGMSAGFHLGVGIDAMFLSVPDEKGFAGLPIIVAGYDSRLFGAQLTVYPMKYHSYYETSIGEEDRLTNSFFGLSAYWLLDVTLEREME
jgi:hypothetical protein